MDNTPLQLLKALNKFTEYMYKRLLANAHKTHWSEEPCNREFLTNELEKRLQQLKEMNPKSNNEVIDFSEKCADIANFAMMLSNNYIYNRYNSKGEFWVKYKNVFN